MYKEPVIRIVKSGEKNQCTLTLDISEISETDFRIFFDLMVYLNGNLKSDMESLDEALLKNGLGEAEEELNARINYGFKRSIQLIQSINKHYSIHFKNETPDS